MTTIRFNAKSAKGFRDTLAKWHNADFELADAMLLKGDRVKAHRAIIASNADLLKKDASARIDKRTDAEIKAETAELEAKIQAENDALAELRKAQADRYEPARKMVTRDLYKGYVAYYQDGDRDAYVEALTVWFNANGVSCTRNDIGDFINVIGKKKNSARQKCKTGKHNGIYSYTTWRDIFLGELCDTLGDLLPMRKFQYVLKNDRK